MILEAFIGTLNRYKCSSQMVGIMPHRAPHTLNGFVTSQLKHELCDPCVWHYSTVEGSLPTPGGRGRTL